MEVSLNKKNNNRNIHIKRNENLKSIKAYFVVILFLFLIVIELFYNGGYYDEILGIASAFYLVFFRRRIERQDMVTLVIIGLVITIGIISNFVSGISNNVFSILVDVVSETKLLFSYFAMKYFLSNKEKQDVINILLPAAKLYTIVNFFCSIISQFVDIGMTYSERYGIKSYRFVFDFSFQYIAVYVLAFGVLVCAEKLSDKQRNRYYFMALVSIFLGIKSSSIMFTVIFLGLVIYFKKHKRISPMLMITGLIIFIAVGWFQIETYLLNESSPRRLFFEYSFKTANTYFPLGSGFGTYGSDQAAKNYSKLYEMYGFNNTFGMNREDTSFLQDTFWPMAIGQFGWIGSLFYIFIFVRIFISFKDNNYSNQRRAFLYAAYLQYMIHAIGSAILSSSAGLIGFMAISLFTLPEQNTEKRKSRLNIHF